MFKRSTSIPIEVLIIEEDGYHLLCIASINGKQARLLIDTGASRSVFDKVRMKNFIEDMSTVVDEKLSTGLGTNSMPTSSIVFQSFEIGELTIENFQAILLDLQHVNVTYGTLGLADIDGVLGNDVFFKYNAVLDYPKRKLKLRLP